MIETRTKGLVYYQYPHLKGQTGLFHGHFTRMGGVSEGLFSALNVSGDMGDRGSHVRENRRRLTDLFTAGRLVSLKQVHGLDVALWSRDAVPQDGPVEADAVLTDEKGVLLMIQTADCQAVMLHDPIRRVIGNIHSGWRGSIGNIIGKTIRAMVDRFGSSPGDILAGVGPSLGPCCAEFVNYREELPERYWMYKDNKDHVDFWALSRDQLMAEGLAQGNIVLSRLCTRCNKDLFFSYRRDKLTGRLANVIGLCSE
ncbi:MAG: peptidoglycan editing factor PgeF [Proteobacteria bacterium]|nr:peptidoglycan editing factor PgeF [Pseudomonadota bacterium]